MAATTPQVTTGPATTGRLTTGPLPLTRGRVAALVIGVPVCLLLIANTGLDLVANFAQGRYAVSYTAPAGTRSLTVTSAGGQLSVRPTAAGQPTLTGTARYTFIRSTLSERTTGGAAAVNYHCVALPAGNCGLNATISVPAAMPVAATTDGGNATVTGTRGPVTLSSGGGSLAADHVSGPLTLNTDGGDITATAITSATVTASSGGGSIEVAFTSVPSDVSVRTSGGDITLVLPPGSTQYHVTANTGGGTVTDTLPQNTSSKKVITATTGGGSITIRQQ